MDRHYYVYIVASKGRRLYTGITNNIERRAWEHREGKIPGFTRQYRIFRLVYYDSYRDVGVAIAREKQIKAWTRAKRIALIESMNPTWEDLAESWFTRTAKQEQVPRFARDDKQETTRAAREQLPRPPRRAWDDKQEATLGAEEQVPRFARDDKERNADERHVNVASAKERKRR